MRIINKCNQLYLFTKLKSYIKFLTKDVDSIAIVM